MSFVASCDFNSLCYEAIALPGVKIYSACSADYTVVTVINIVPVVTAVAVVLLRQVAALGILLDSPRS